MIKNLIIREEKTEDYYNTELMAMRSFWNKYYPGASEHYLIRIVRESEDYIPEISHVAELDGKIVGAVFYTRAWIVDGDICQVRYWEFLIPARILSDLSQKPIAGSDVIFEWNHKGESRIIKVFKNLLE
ncbi:hypothetical protein [Pseudobutyrivibrio xylanivorans]|uniref:Acetyltransferase (GNAT) domain-containing protein n=1 Tax=Pseudobutyrivibrio xylanivorans DSM 14809 TaxID=1123012 RepID=A0A1M6KHL7_PSEXY|nr:hypothetical protein [Pseudobutyrivibrio xylanivorans]SHJ58417.1 hypothetical protein SAMN02745725_02866 [Pseudobutyrivibrio xylanivorans DSM 14809]